MEPVLSPASCALAVALPLSEDAFLRDAADPGKDFARSAIARSQRTPAAAWREIYAPKVVRLYERIAAHARGLGATVVPGVTAAMLRELLEAFPLVSLFAHSMSPPIVSADVAAPRAILDAVRAGETIVARHLRETFANRTWASDEATLASQVAAALDAALALTRAWTETAVRSERAGRPARLLGRVMLEDSFGGARRRAPVIELCDGGHTMDALCAAVPRGFAGVLDLSVCNSFVLGESLKRRRPECLIVENVFLARVDVRLARYGLVLNRLARAPARYTDALTDVTRALIGGP